MQQRGLNVERRFMTNGHFESTFSKYAFGRGGGGGHKKEYDVYARENDDNYGRPLRQAGDRLDRCWFLSMHLSFYPTHHVMTTNVHY